MFIEKINRKQKFAFNVYKKNMTKGCIVRKRTFELIRKKLWGAFIINKIRNSRINQEHKKKPCPNASHTV